MFDLRNLKLKGVKGMTSIHMDYSELRRLIRYKFGTETNFANEISMSSVSLSGKLNNKVGFTSSEIIELSSKLNISKEEIPKYFFTPKLKKT